MNIETTEWKPEGHFFKGRGYSATRLALQQMKVGEVLRITHDDITCSYSKSNVACGIAPMIGSLRRSGWKIDYYHEAYQIAVVRRTK